MEMFGGEASQERLYEKLDFLGTMKYHFRAADAVGEVWPPASMLSERFSRWVAHMYLGSCGHGRLLVDVWLWARELK